MTSVIAMAEPGDRATAEPSTSRLLTSLRRTLSGVRLRIVVGYVALLSIALAVAVLVTRQVQLARADREFELEQAQEIEELRKLAEGIDPDTGEPFAGDVESIFLT